MPLVTTVSGPRAVRHHLAAGTGPRRRAPGRPAASTSRSASAQRHVDVTPALRARRTATSATWSASVPHMPRRPNGARARTASATGPNTATSAVGGRRPATPRPTAPSSAPGPPAHRGRRPAAETVRHGHGHLVEPGGVAEPQRHRRGGQRQRPPLVEQAPDRRARRGGRPAGRRSARPARSRCPPAVAPQLGLAPRRRAPAGSARRSVEPRPIRGRRPRRRSAASRSTGRAGRP